MKLKKTAIFLFAAMLFCIVSLPVAADAVSPINYSCFITHQDGVGSIHFKFLNNTIQPITYIEYKASLYDTSFSPAFDSSNKASSCRIKISNISVAGYYDDTDIVTNLAAYPTAAHVGKVSYLKVGFDDGTFWESSDINFSQSTAAIACSNSLLNDAYLAPDGKLHLTDASTGSNTRSWFYWSDAEMGWVHFSDDLKPELENAAQHPCIKLVINADENLYKIQSFDLAQAAKIAVTCYNTSTTKYSDQGILTFETAEMHPPFKFALWDFAEGYDKVNWYIWSDEYSAWEFLSNERGPIVDSLSKHPMCLKVEYNDDPTNFIIYDIYMQ